MHQATKTNLRFIITQTLTSDIFLLAVTGGKDGLTNSPVSVLSPWSCVASYMDRDIKIFTICALKE